jgi:O-antigen/teichoic acid export membrane protein
MGHAQFGAYAALFQVAYVLSPVLDLGTAMLITRQIAAGHNTTAALRNAWGLRLVLAFAYFALLLALGLALGYDGRNLLRLLQLGLLQTALAVLVFYRAVLQGRLQFAWDAVASVSITVLAGACVGWLLLVDAPFTLDGYLQLSLGCTIGAMLLFSIVFLRQGGSLRASFQVKALFDYARQSVPLALMALALAANERANQVVLERLAGPQANGVYNAAFRWFAAAAMYLWTIMPVFYARLAAADRAQQIQLLRHGTVITALPMLWVCGIFIWHGDLLFALYRHSNTADLARMAQHLQLLGVALALHAVFVLAGTHLTAAGKPHLVMVAALVAAITNMGLTAGLLPLAGPVSASWAMAGAMVVLVAGYVLLHWRALGVPLPWDVYRRLALAFGASMAVLAGCRHLHLHWSLGLLLAGGVLLAAGLPPDARRALQQILREKRLF